MKEARRSRRGLLLVLILTFAVFAPTLGNDFTNDDRYVALGMADSGQPNARVHELQPLGVYFGSHYWADTFETGRLYRPLTVLSFALRHRFFGDSAWPAHLANVLLHVLATWLVYLLARDLAHARAGLVAAAVFGLHAVHSEVVASVVGRSDLLAFCCGAAALLLARAERARHGASVLAVLLLFLALCAKESAVAWVPLLLLFGRVPLLRRFATAIVPLGAYLLLRHAALSAVSAPDPTPYLNSPLAQAATGTRLLTATHVLGLALWLLCAPVRLASDYGPAVFPLIDRPDPAFALAALVLVALALAGWLCRRRRTALFGTVAFFASALVTSNHIVPIGTVFAERLLYLPSLGFAMLVATLCELPAVRRHARVSIAILVLWLGVSGVIAVRRGIVWRSDASLVLTDVETQPRSVRLRMSAGLILQQRGELDRALGHLQEAVALGPEIAVAWSSLGALQFERGELAAAERAFRRGLAAEHAGTPEDRAPLHANLASVYLQRDEPERAIPELVSSLVQDPSLFGSFDQLYLLRAGGKLTPKQLMDLLRQAETRPPGRPHWRLYRGILAHREKAFGAAVKLLDGFWLRLAPRRRNEELRAHARFALGHSLVRLGRRQEAAGLLRQLAADRAAPAILRQEAEKLLR